MKHATALTDALLWAAAIIASAAIARSTYLSLILLPSLAAMSLLPGWQTRSVEQCQRRNPGGTSPGIGR